jgi:hypothetical protein
MVQCFDDAFILFVKWMMVSPAPQISQDMEFPRTSRPLENQKRRSPSRGNSNYHITDFLLTLSELLAKKDTFFRGIDQAHNFLVILLHILSFFL